MKVGLAGKVAGVAGALGAVALAGVAAASRPWHARWGATSAEVSRPLPGDDLIPDPEYVTNHAVTISAPIEAVWPWLAQIGYKRAGWYSYDALHRLMGAAGSVDDPRHSATRVVPELQDVKQGDVIRIFEAGPYNVVAVEPPRLLLLGTGAGPDVDVNPQMGGMTWAWVLERADANTTRFLIRGRGIYSSNPVVRALYKLIVDPGGFLMERRTMLNIKARAEALAASK